MRRAAALVLVAAALVSCTGSTKERHPLDDLSAAALAYVLPDAESVGARSYVCDDTNDCAGASRLADPETWVEVTELRARSLRFSRVLAGPVLRSPLDIVVEPHGRPGDVAELLHSGHRVVAGLITEGLVRPGVDVVVAIDDQGRAAAIGPTGGDTTVELARGAIGSPSAEAYLRSMLGWSD